MVCTMSESSEDEEFIGQYGGGSFGGSDDDDCDIPIFGFDGGDGSGKPRSKPKDGFEYATPPASDADDDEYDASYAQQTRAALTRLIDQADAALFGDDLLSTGKAASQADPAPPHVAECHEWRSTLGCLRVCVLRCFHRLVTCPRLTLAHRTATHMTVRAMATTLAREGQMTMATLAPSRQKSTACSARRSRRNRSSYT